MGLKKRPVHILSCRPRIAYQRLTNAIIILVLETLALSGFAQ